MTLTLTPSKGSPRGGQTVTITGASFGATAGTVTIGTELATVLSWSDSSVQIKTPANRDASGRLKSAGQSIVSVALTKSGGGTEAGSYTYTGTLLEAALGKVRTRIGAVRIASGDFFDILPAQVEPGKKDGSLDTTAGYPQVRVFPETAGYGNGQGVGDAAYQHYAGNVPCRCQAEFPIKDHRTWTTEAQWLIADLFRAIRRTQSDIGGIANSIDVDTWEIGQIVYEGAGSNAAVDITFTIQLEHIDNDMTTATEWAP